MLRVEGSFVLAVNDSKRNGNVSLNSSKSTFSLDLLSAFPRKSLIIDLLALCLAGSRRASVSDPHNNTIVPVQNARPCLWQKSSRLLPKGRAVWIKDGRPIGTA